MPEWKCPSCGAVAEVGEKDLVTVCRYCKTCFTTEGAIEKEHYLIPTYYSSNRAVENLLLWVKKQIGAEEDLPLHIELAHVTLDFYPFWHVNIDAETKFTGVGEDAFYSSPEGFNQYRGISYTSKPESGTLDRSFSLTYPASPKIPIEVVDYQFPTRSKRYFSESYAQEYGGEIHNGELTRDMIEERAKRDALNYMTAHLRKEIFEVTSRTDDISVSSVYYLHAPIWSIRYRFNKKNYGAFVDASTGRVVHATYPISIEYRAINGTLAAAHLTVALATGLFVSSFAPFAGLALLAGIGGAGVVFLFRSLQFGAGKEAAK